MRYNTYNELYDVTYTQNGEETTIQRNTWRWLWKNMKKVAGKNAPSIAFFCIKPYFRFLLRCDLKYDLLQEITLECVLSQGQPNLKRLSKTLRQLAADYGYRRGTGGGSYNLKECVDIEKMLNDLTPPESDESDQLYFAESVISFYKTHTLKETCAEFNLTNTPRLRKTLSKLCPKSSHGGARSGAGRAPKWWHICHAHAKERLVSRYGMELTKTMTDHLLNAVRTNSAKRMGTDGVYMSEYEGKRFYFAPGYSETFGVDFIKTFLTEDMKF